MPTNGEIPTNEYFPETDDSGKVILFHVYVDTFLLTEDGGTNANDAIKYDSNDEYFIKTVTAKFSRNFVSLLRSITNTSCANLSPDMLNHLFDETGNLYDCETYKKSVFALLTDNNVKVSTFYTIDDSNQTITRISTDKTCNTAYFTFKLRFKYKLLDFVVQFEIGHDIYQDDNIFNQNDSTITGNLTVSNDLTVANNATISKNLTVSCNTIIDKNLTINGTTNMNENVTIGDSCNSYDVLIYGGDENDGTQIKWTGSSSTLSLQGSLLVGSVNDSYPVTFLSTNGKLEWLNTTDKLNIVGHLDVSEHVNIDGDITVGSNVNGSNMTIWGSGTSGNEKNKITWDKTNDTLRIKGHLHHGDSGSGHTLHIHSNTPTKHITWNPETCKLQINGNICVGEACNGCIFKIWGKDSGKYMEWNSQCNKLSIIGNIDIGSLAEKQTLKLYGAISGLETPLIWDGGCGTLTNDGKTVLNNITEINNNLTIGFDGSEYDLTVYSSNGHYLKWDGSLHTLSVNGDLKVVDETILCDKLTTLKDVSFDGCNTGCGVFWTQSNNTLQINGTTVLYGALNVNTIAGSVVYINSNITLENPVQINDTLTIGDTSSGYNVTLHGASPGKYVEWDNNILQVNGAVDIKGTDPTKSVLWTHDPGVLEVSGISNFTNTLNVSGDSNFTNNSIFTSNVYITDTGSLELDGGNYNNESKYITWQPSTTNLPAKLNIISDVEMSNNKLQLIDNDLTIKSCSNNSYVKWDKSTTELKVNATSTFSGFFEINSITTDSTIEWDNDNTLTLDANVHVNGSNRSLTLQNDTASVVWNYTDGGNGDSKLTVNSDFLINFGDSSSTVYSEFLENYIQLDVCTKLTKDIYIGGELGTIEWTESTSVLDSNGTINSHGVLNTYDDVNICGSAQCANNNLKWDASEGILTVDAIVKLQNDGNSKYVKWDTDKLTINANLDVKEGDINIYDVTGTSRLEWNHTNNILTTTGCEFILQNDASTKKIHWNPAGDLLYIISPTTIDGTVILNGTDAFAAKNITWTSTTGEYKIEATDLNVLCPSNFTGNITSLDSDILFNGNCGKLEWLHATDAFNVVGDTTLNGDVTFVGETGGCSIVWDKSADTLTATADVILSGTDTTYSTSWDKSDNRLTVTGSLIKTPCIINDNGPNCNGPNGTVSGNINLDMQNNNNFHLSLCGNITLENPTGICSGQEGRIVIETNGTNRIINFPINSIWRFENSQCIELSQNAGNAIDVLVYYVMANDKILVRIEKNYGECPPPSNC